MKKLFTILFLFCLVGTALNAQVQTGKNLNGQKKTNAANAVNDANAKANSKAIRDVIETYNNFKNNLSSNHTGYEDELPAYIVSGNTAYRLVTKPHDLKKESSATSDILAQDFSNVYPGAIVYADADLANGHPRLVGLDPGKVTVSIDFNPGKGCPSSLSNVPNKASRVADSIYKILNLAKNSPSIDFGHKYKCVSSVNELTATLNVDAKFLKNTVKVNTSTTSAQSTVTSVDDYTQKYYTVKCDWESDPSKYFGPNVTGEQVKAKIKKNGPIAVITSVTYGRRAYIFSDVTSSNFKFHGDESANIYGQSISSVQDIVKNAKDSSVWMWVAGTDAGSASLMMKGKNLRNSMLKCLKFHADTNQGTPLTYTVKILGSNKSIDVQPTGTYNTVEYEAMPKYVSCTFQNNAFVIAGGGLKMRVDYKVIKFVKKGNTYEKVEVTKEKDVETGFTRWNERNMGKGDKKTFNLTLNEGEFIDGPIRVQLRQKRSSAKNWSNTVVTYVYPKGNELVIVCGGDIRPGGTDAYIHSSSKLIYAKDQ